MKDKVQYLVIYTLKGKLLNKIISAYSVYQAKFLFTKYNDYDSIEEVFRA